MAKVQLFANWTWRTTLPAPFDTVTDIVSKVHFSRYCTTSMKKSTLHSYILSAILAYLDMDTSFGTTPLGSNAIGTQGDKIVAEYESRTKERHVVVFNKKNGKFNVGRFADATSSPKVYALKEGGNTGTALFFCLMPEALTDDEFKDCYNLLGHQKSKGYPDMDETLTAAFVLCDNLYRRIEGADLVGSAGIHVNIPTTGNIAPLTTMNLNKHAYSPSSILYGDFTILTKDTSTSTSPINIKKEDFIGKFPLSKRTFTPEEKMLIPNIEDWNVITPEALFICKHAHKTTGTTQPMRNFMLRGPAGSGKTEDAKTIAAGLGLPYLFYTCSSNTEIYDFSMQAIPETKSLSKAIRDYPTLTDIQMDPPSAYKKLTGIYDDTVTEDMVYEKLLEVMKEDSTALASDNAGGQRFKYVETPLITAIRNGYLIEIQEPTVIANPGVLVGLNALLDRCASITLVTGEVVKRHPDTVVIITTNSNYAGCRDLNQSVLSRMNLIFDVETPDVETMANRAMNITGCTDKRMVLDMAQAILDISERCRETMITDGSCGMRELINWVQSYMICEDAMEAAKYTILASVSSDAENRADILSSCLEHKFVA